MKPERKNSVCVIDDDEEFTHFVERYLTSIGHKVRAYTAPAAFLADPEALHCDIYLVDLMLPGLDGIPRAHQDLGDAAADSRAHIDEPLGGHDHAGAGHGLRGATEHGP